MVRDVLKTRLCEMFGIEYPIVAFSHCKDVVVAVSQAGGMAVLGEVGHTPDEIAADVAWIRDRIGDYPFGVDLVFPATVPAQRMSLEDMEARISDEHHAFAAKIRAQYGLPDPKPGLREPTGFASQQASRDQAEVVLDLRVPVIASGLGSPAFLLDAAHARGMKVFGLIGKVRQARREIEAGVVEHSQPGVGRGTQPCLLIGTERLCRSHHGNTAMVRAPHARGSRRHCNG